MINKIGIKNFRVFKEMTELQLRPLTILTGPNNSGKSSFSKLLLLLKNGIEKLDFKKGTHELESLENILNWENTKKKESLNAMRIRIPHKFLPTDFDMDMIYPKMNGRRTGDREFDFWKNNWSENECNIEIHNDRDTLFKMKKYEEGYYDYMNYMNRKILVGGINKILGINIDVIQLINLIYEKKFVVEYKKPKDLQSLGRKKIPLSEFEYDKKTAGFLTLDNFVSYFIEGDHVEAENIVNQRNIALSNKIDGLERDYKLYRVWVNGKEVDEIYPDLVLTLQKELFENFKLDGEKVLNELEKRKTIQYNTDFFDKSLAEQLQFALDVVLNKQIKQEIAAAVVEKYSQDFKIVDVDVDVNIKETDLGDLIFNQKLFDYFNEHKIKKKDIGNIFRRTFISCLSPDLQNPFKNTVKFGINRAVQKRVLLNSGNSEMADVMGYYGKMEEYIKVANKPLLKQTLEILGVEGKLRLKQYEQTITVPYLEKSNGKKVNLADLGFGYAQIFTLVLKILQEKDGKGERIFIIEEPEANLHPDFQSKLADILALLIKEYNKSKRNVFIIETHSEYLIRKLQYLVAKEDVITDERQFNKVNNPESLETKDVVIYYFNDDKYVTKEEPKVKEIEITESGNLTDTFGPGFFDEATKLQFELMKLNKEQRN